MGDGGGGDIVFADGSSGLDFSTLTGGIGFGGDCTRSDGLASFSTGDSVVTMTSFFGCGDGR